MAQSLTFSLLQAEILPVAHLPCNIRYTAQVSPLLKDVGVYLLSTYIHIYICSSYGPLYSMLRTCIKVTSYQQRMIS